MFLQEAYTGLIHLFYPRLCEGCNKPLTNAEQIVCISCALELPETGYHHLEGNETALRFAGRIPFVHATSYAYYTSDGLLQHLLHGLKYRNKKETGYFLGRQFGYSLRNTMPKPKAEDEGNALADWLPSIDMIIPVPLHAAKMAKRGYNQSMLIGEGMSEVLQIPVSDKLLARVKNTESQTNKTRAERDTNVFGAFGVSKKTDLKRKHILLLDDVLTTGATIAACAQALAGVEGIKISVATIGIAIS